VFSGRPSVLIKVDKIIDGQMLFRYTAYQLLNKCVMQTHGSDSDQVYPLGFSFFHKETVIMPQALLETEQGESEQAQYFAGSGRHQLDCKLVDASCILRSRANG